jgi:2-polyprenyl-3-methyl-5-hydroxy-6-metoxy-1,4-benzoquinol methylase
MSLQQTKTDPETCPVCDSPRVQPLFQMVDRFFQVVDDSFLLYRCESCGLSFLSESQFEGRLGTFYPPGYWWNEAGRYSSLVARYRETLIRCDQLRFVISFSAKPNQRLLDIGCGGGAFVKLACSKGFDAYGMETAEEALQLADRTTVGRILMTSEEELIRQGEKFDIITLFHVLEHLPDPVRYLRSLRGLLRDSGQLIVQVPNSSSLQARLLGKRWYGLDCPRHLRNFDTHALLYLLGKTGYRVKVVRHFSLRDNAAALVSSLFPRLDPMSRRVGGVREGRKLSWGSKIQDGLYLVLLMCAQPLAALEAGLGCGATITVCAAVD